MSIPPAVPALPRTRVPRPTAGALAAPCLMAGLVFGCGPGGAEAGPEPAPVATPAVDGGRTGRVNGGGTDAGVVVAWNEVAYEVAFRADSFRTFRGQRALAMVHLAMHDALNTIEPRYERYGYRGDAVAADPVAAASHAAYGVLLDLYPDERERLDAALAKWSGDDARAGSALGRASAAAIVAARDGDAWDRPGSYAFREGAGQYRTTPDWNGFVVQPGFAEARLLALPAPDHFRPAPPPPIDRPEYAHAFDEVKASGALASAVRTPDQSAYAVWWMEYAEGSVNRVARRLVIERGLDAWEAARLFAHLGMALFDGYVATWDGKYAYNHWRPWTAIRSAASDGNAATEPDTAWTSLLPAPPFPEYPSAHATGCAASFTVLASVFGDSTRFTMTTITAPEGMPSRSFRSFGDAAAECADSRVRLGWHFRYATDAGLELGRRVAGHVLDTQLQPGRERHTAPVK